ncbi:MAG: tRNA lysidine(34) synthetase TilS, partial [Bacteroidales bacterium]
MLLAFKNFVKNQKLPVSKSVTLLGVSGGIDSMVMADLFEKAGYQYAVAHCNFNLRDNESDEDEQFVIDHFSQKKIPLFTKKFNTSAFANENKMSIQMAARELRIEWFNTLLKKQNLSYFATAHHLNDQLETFFINLLRGTGIAGLHGILPVYGKGIHPLLFTWREDIVNYAKWHKIPFREDSSNKKTDYTRNKIRHELLPLLKKITPEAEKILTENISRIRSAENVFIKKMEDFKKELIIQNGHEIQLRIDSLKKFDNKEIILYEIVSAYQFNYSDVLDMIKSLSTIPGKQ